MNLIDTHAHLDHVDNIDQALQEASDAGVSAIIAPGIDIHSNQKNIEIRKRIKKPQIFVAVGIHPESLEVFDESQIEKSLKFVSDNADTAVAIGEIGLDYWYKWVRKDNHKKEQQREIFRLQLELAKKKNLPVIIHSRGAWRDCLSMTRQSGVKKAVFHWYSGPVDILDEILKEGYFISATPALHYSEPLKEAVINTSIEQMFIETDSPVYYRYDDSGFSAAPKDVFKTLELYSNIKNIPAQQAADILNQNAKQFFELPQ